jgi:uncharacterized membrane protein
MSHKSEHKDNFYFIKIKEEEDKTNDKDIDNKIIGRYLVKNLIDITIIIIKFIKIVINIFGCFV